MWWLTAGLILAAAVVGVVAWTRSRRARPQHARPIANSHRLTRIPGYRRSLKRSSLQASLALVTLSVLVVLAAIGSGRWIYQRVEQPEKFNRDIVLCLDVSGSMVDYDVQVIQRYLEMLPGFQGERISLVLWDATAVPVFPLTDDYDFVNDQLKLVADSMESYGSVGSEYFAGTRNSGGASLVGDGLASCALMFGETTDDGRSRSIIFATDNAVNGDALMSLPEAAALTKERKITVYGLDANEFEDAFADEYRVQIEQNGGKYFKLSDESSISAIVDDITSEQTSIIRGAPIVLITDRPAGWLIAILGVLVGYLVLAWRLKL